MKRTLLTTAILLAFLLPAAAQERMWYGHKVLEYAVGGKMIEGYESPARPGETLRFGVTYTDEFEYVEWNGDLDYTYFVMCSPGDEEYLHLYDDLDDNDRIPYPEFVRGDRMLVEWHIGLASEAGDNETPYLTKWATKVDKIADGPVSRFRAAHPDRLRNVLPNGWDPPEREAERVRELYTDPYYYGAAEYYVATSRKPEVRAFAADPSLAIRYTITKQERGGMDFRVFEIWNDADTAEGELPEPLATFWLSQNWPHTIYEYDPATDELTKFARY
jgi:hypothetical protein